MIGSLKFSDKSINNYFNHSLIYDSKLINIISKVNISEHIKLFMFPAWKKFYHSNTLKVFTQKKLQVSPDAKFLVFFLTWPILPVFRHLSHLAFLLLNFIYNCKGKKRQYHSTSSSNLYKPLPVFSTLDQSYLI